MSPAWFTRVLAPGDAGPDVSAMQSRLGVWATGEFDDLTESYVRGVQKAFSLPVTGEVDASTAHAIGERERARFGLPPTWYEEGRHQRVAELLGSDDADTIKRFQGNRGLPATGLVDEATAIALGE